MEKEIAMGFGVSVICLLASSFVAPSQTPWLNAYRSADAAQSALPTEATVESLPDGHYQFCRTGAETPSTAIHCFLFQKENTRMIGQYQEGSLTETATNLCIDGNIRGNVLSGKSTYFLSDATNPMQQRPELQDADLINWDATGDTDYLKVAEGRVLDVKTVSQDALAIESTHSVRFGKTTLDLSDFHRHETVTVSPPTSCEA